jgi:O-antigen ligase
MSLYFLFYYGAQDVKTIRLLFAVLLGVALLASVQMMREAIDYGIGSYRETRRVAGPFGPYNHRQANLAAAYLIVFIPLFVSVFMLYKSKTSLRWIAFASTIVCVMALFFTGSRQAYFILAFLGVLMALRRGLMMTVFAIILVLGYEFWIPESAVQRIEMTQTVDEQGNTVIDESTGSRFVQWAGAMELFGDRPWGIGLNHFKREIGEASAISNLDAHNFYVLILTEAGIQGLATLMIVLIGLYRLARRVQRLDSSEETQVLGWGYTMALVGMMLGNVFGSRFFDEQVMGNFWMLSGLVARYYTLALEGATAHTKAGDQGPLGIATNYQAVENRRNNTA